MYYAIFIIIIKSIIYYQNIQYINVKCKKFA